jgi:hypothetical protein
LSKYGFNDDDAPTRNVVSIGQARHAHITQQLFLKELFGSGFTRGATLHIGKNPDWTRYKINFESDSFNPARDNYFSVGEFFSEGNGKEDSNNMRVFVADDLPLEFLSQKQITPTYILQTSERKAPDNKPSYQVGFKLKDGHNLRLADKAMELARTKGLGDKSGNNRIRMARLPQSTNNKTKTPFEVRLTEWNPEALFTLKEVMEHLELEQRIEIQQPDVVPKMDVGAVVKQILAGESFHDNTNRLAMHLAAKGLREDSAKDIIKGIYLSIDNKDERWRERYEDIDRSVETGYGKITERSDPAEPLLIPIAQWEDTMITPDWVIDGFIGEGVRSISGAQGKGKTSIIAPLAANVAHLTTPNFLTPRHRRKVFYFTEDTNQLNRMVMGMKMHQSEATREEWAEYFQIHLTKRYKKGDLEQLAEHIKDHVSLQGTKVIPPLVIFDTQAASFDIEDENNNAMLSKLLSQLKICFWERHRIPVWVINHITKDTFTSEDYENLTARGASAIAGDCHGTMGIVEVQGLEGRILANIKDRDGAKTKEVRATISRHTTAGLTPYGEPDTVDYFTTEYLESSKELRKNISSANQMDDLKGKVYQAIQNLNELGQSATIDSLTKLKLGAAKDRIAQACVDLQNMNRIEAVNPKDLPKEERERLGAGPNTKSLFRILGVYLG